MEIREIDVWTGAFPYERVLSGPEPPLGALAAAALADGIGRRGRVGEATAHLFPAGPLVAHAVAWLERRFAGRSPGAGIR